MSQEMVSSSQKRKIEELEQTKSTHDVLRIAEEPKRVKEAGTEEEKKVHPKYKVMLDVALMKGRLKALKHIAEGNDDADCELKKEIEDLTIDLKIKTEELEKLEAMNTTMIFKKCKSNDELQEARKQIEDLKAMNHSLIVKERQTNDELQETRKKLEDIEAMNQTLLVRERQSNKELQEARKELINVFKNCDLIQVKRPGELDLKPFLDACKKKYSANEADITPIDVLILPIDVKPNQQFVADGVGAFEKMAESGDLNEKRFIESKTYTRRNKDSGKRCGKPKKTPICHLNPSGVLGASSEIVNAETLPKSREEEDKSSCEVEKNLEDVVTCEDATEESEHGTDHMGELCVKKLK